jgi:putative endonuclease
MKLKADFPKLGPQDMAAFRLSQGEDPLDALRMPRRWLRRVPPRKVSARGARQGASGWFQRLKCSVLRLLMAHRHAGARAPRCAILRLLVPPVILKVQASACAGLTGRIPISDGSIMRWGDRAYYLYVMSSPSRVLYTGVTNDLRRRVTEHKQKTTGFFTARHSVTRLVYYEEFRRINDAIAREKKIKIVLRARKIELIESMNPGWDDLCTDW